MIIDVTRLADRMLQGRLPTGVDRVNLEYVRHFVAGAQALVRLAGRWIVLPPSDSERVFTALLRPDSEGARVLRWAVGRRYALPWGRSRGPSVLLHTGHSGLEHPSYATEVRRHGWKPIFFLHDLIPITHPEYCRPGESERHRRRVQTMVTTGQGVIVNSATTRDALSSWAQIQGWPLPPSMIAPLAPAQLPTPSGVRPFAEPYFVILGTIEPRKNHLLLLQLWRQLIAELGPAAPRLVVIGQRGWECEQVVDMLERCEALKGTVVELSECDDAALATWLHHAHALLFPSFVEGFGIPLVEALSLGTPVIASDLPVFREIAGDIPDYLGPLDGPGWRHAVLDYLRPDSAVRRAQLARMTGFVAQTWSGHFERVDRFIESLVARS